MLTSSIISMFVVISSECTALWESLTVSMQ